MKRWLWRKLAWVFWSLCSRCADLAEIFDVDFQQELINAMNGPVSRTLDGAVPFNNATSSEWQGLPEGWTWADNP